MGYLIHKISLYNCPRISKILKIFWIFFFFRVQNLGDDLTKILGNLFLSTKMVELGLIPCPGFASLMFKLFLQIEFKLCLLFVQTCWISMLIIRFTVVQARKVALFCLSFTELWNFSYNFGYCFCPSLHPLKFKRD